MAPSTTTQRAAATKPPNTAGISPSPVVSAAERREMIAVAAYYQSQRRIDAGEAADEIEDWLQAEKAVDQAIARSPPAHQHGRSRRG